MNQPRIALQGNLGTDVRSRLAGGQSVADFRLAVTPSRLDRASGAWVEEETQWYTVTVWRELADHCAASLRRGDPVVVQGRLSARSWTDGAGVKQTSMEVTATGVGHDLARGTSTFTRRRPPLEQAQEQTQEQAQPVEPAESVATAPDVVAA